MEGQNQTNAPTSPMATPTHTSIQSTQPTPPAPVAPPQPVITPTNTKSNKSKKTSAGMMIAVIILAIASISGIAFGIIELMESSQKDSTIAMLNNKVANCANQNNDTNNSSNNDTDESNSSKTFSNNVLAGIKNLGNLVYGFKSYDTGNGVIYEYIDSNGDLLLQKEQKHTIASDVIYADFLYSSNDGVPSLYFVKNDGSVGVVKNIIYIDTENPEIENVELASKVISVKNVSNPGGLHKVIAIDINGNFLDL